MPLRPGDNSQVAQCNRQQCPLYWTEQGDTDVRDHFAFHEPPAIDSVRRLLLEVLGMTGFLFILTIAAQIIL